MGPELNFTKGRLPMKADRGDFVLVVKKCDAVRGSYKAAALQFVTMELDTARTFYEAALTTRDPSRFFSCIRSANTAVRTALRTSKHIRVSDEEQRMIAEGISRLLSLFERVKSKSADKSQFTLHPQVPLPWCSVKASSKAL